PGGRFYFIEHVAAPPDTSLRLWQDRLTPVWRGLSGGCRLNRETWTSLEAAGFGKLRYDYFRMQDFPGILSPHIIGIATKLP
ncbi:MAG: class I SAM-dependent methyltransferase, partial [Candidatus Zixiibacteriota bacterium]